MNRRHFLRATGLGTAGSMLAVTGCRDSLDANSTASPPPGYRRRDPQQTGATREVHLVAEEGEVEVATGKIYRTWLYNGQFPGPEIRLQEGERLRVTLENQLPEGTTIHWHGLPVPNAMDGVPGLTQQPVMPGTTFTYDFVADPAGSYLYHSHVGLQIDRGLVAPLVVEEKQPHVSYDRDYSLVLDDYLPNTPEPLQASGGMMRRGRRGMMGPGMMQGQTPPYEGLLINGKLPNDPAVFETKRGEQVRLRLMNPSGATTFRVAVGGHRMLVTHTDGQPIEPVTVDALHIGMGERYDVVLAAQNPGVWPIMAAPLEVQAPPAEAVLRYTDVAATQAPPEAVPEGIRGGRVLELSDLQALERPAERTPTRTFDLTLSGGMMSAAWTIVGQAYPDADPLEILEGDVIRLRMVNHSMMLHPMHLHGHFFQVGGALKDTVIVPPHMGRVTVDFLADNPGRWFFHCHNIYHLEAGMAREIRYV